MKAVPGKKVMKPIRNILRAIFRRKKEVKRESLYDENWVLLRRFNTPLEAEMAADLLKQASVPTYQLNSTVNLYMRGRGESNLYVRACDLDQAVRVLREMSETTCGTGENM